MWTNKLNLVVSPLCICIFWLIHWNLPHFPTPISLKSENPVHTFTLENINESLTLFSNTLRGALESLDPDTNEIKAVNELINSFCELRTNDASSAFHVSCCVNPDTKNVSILLNCLKIGGNLGSMPIPVTEKSLSTILPKDPPPFVHLHIYTDEPRLAGTDFACHVELDKRKSMYHLLLRWIDLANEHRIVWWLHYGSLLGSLRHGDFIPYDHDLDIAILGTEENTVRRFSTKNPNLNFTEVFFYSRHGNYCVNDASPRINCQGVPVRYQQDPCGFCTTFTRIISGYRTFLDIFSVHPRIIMKLSEGNSPRFGLLDEAVDGDQTNVLSYRLSLIFPLTTCSYMGLKLPCPRDSASVLSHVYGENFIQPSKKCNQQFGYWQSS